MTLSDLPEIEITRNIRSTRLRLRVDAQKIKVTAPVFCTNRQIQNFIAQSETWLIETWQKQQARIADQIQNQVLPSTLQLFNRAEPLQIHYQTQKQNFVFNDKVNQLLVSDRQASAYLKLFIIAYAKEHLPLYLREVSVASGLLFRQCAIRQPKTRWGSCTSKHDIMLNSGLVLFPQEIARYVCVHELAHTKHFDHSVSFWDEVQKHDANFQEHRKVLKKSPMPWWW